MRIAILLLLVFFCFGQKKPQNFQRRGLYYDIYDHACHSGLPTRKDLLPISLCYDEIVCKGFLGDAGTYCNDLTSKPWKKVAPASDWYFWKKNDKQGKNITQLKFGQEIEIQRTPFLGRMKSMVAKTYIINPAIIYGFEYECEVIGTGNIQHYGIYQKTQLPYIRVMCKKSAKTINQQ